MKKCSIKDLARIIKAAPAGDIAGSVTGVSTDSRIIKPGDCFFAVVGDNFDGHNYVEQAIAKGAVCAVVSKDVEGAPILKVADTVKALGDFARHYRQQADYKVIAITGSVGKTTTRQIAYHVLSRHFRVSQAQKNFNNQIGLPLTLLDADEDTQIVVAELGTNYPGEIAYLTRIALPDVAVITSVCPAHLEGLGDLQTIIEEKLSISEGLQPDGIFIINGDFDQLVSTYKAKDKNIAGFFTFGKSDCCDIQAHDISNHGFGSSFTVDGIQVYLPLPGMGNIDNALAAWAVCSRFGLTIEDFAMAVKTQPAVSMRAEILQIGTLMVLNDSYNANPASMINALDILSKIDSTGKRRLVFICGDMAELGSQTENLHAELGACITGAGVKLVIAVGKFAEIAAEAAKSSAQYHLDIKCFEDALSACNNLKDYIKDYDIILVKGSRIAKLEMAVDMLKELFS